MKVTLYYADWCGHCKTFKPTWEKLKTKFETIGIKYDEYEHGKDQKIIEENNIEGFPTIQIENNGEVKDYSGSREYNEILNYLNKNNSDISQSGGSINYKQLYLKYKKKYINLKNKIR
tara:strand:- start:60 stop:413 length:354 start_codon:yes stop_codon:yes gene_type:complete